MAIDGAAPSAERVHIMYQAVNGAGREDKELPLRLLLLADFTGRADGTPLEERKPVVVTRETFDEVLASHHLCLDLAVADRLGDHGGEFPVSLRVGALRDFTPEAIARQVPELRRLLDLREALVALKGPLSDLPTFRSRIHEIVGDPAARAALSAELGRA